MQSACKNGVCPYATSLQPLVSSFFIFTLRLDIFFLWLSEWFEGGGSIFYTLCDWVKDRKFGQKKKHDHIYYNLDGLFFSTPTIRRRFITRSKKVGFFRWRPYIDQSSQTATIFLQRKDKVAYNSEEKKR